MSQAVFTPGQEEQFIYPVAVDVAMIDANGALYPAAWQSLVLPVLQKHLVNLHMDVPTLIRKWGISWVILSLHLKIARTVRLNEALTVRTWNAGGTPPLYRREFTVEDSDGNTVANGTSYSVLLDIKTRRICTDKEILAEFSMPVGRQLLQAESRYSETDGFETVETRTARPSWADAVGHVNNVRYQEMAYDALTEPERKTLKKLTRLDIWFSGEITPGDIVTVQKRKAGNEIFVRGIRQQDGKTSFVTGYTLQKDE